MTYSNDPNWRKFMDQKWKDLQKGQKEREDLEIIQRTSFPKTEPLGNINKKAQRSPIKPQRPPIKPQRPMRKGTRAEPKKAGTAIYPTRKVVHEFDMPAAGKRRRELGAKANPTEKELLEYRDLSNKMEEEIEKRTKQFTDDMSKA